MTIARVFACAFVLIVASSTPSYAKADPLAGDWIVELDKTVDQPPVTISFTRERNRVRFSNSESPMQYTAAYDDTPVPMEGVPNMQVSLRKVSDRHYVMKTFMGSRENDVTDNIISNDGRDMVCTRRPAGQPSAPGLVVAYRKMVEPVPDDLLLGTWQIDYRKSEPPGGVFPVALHIDKKKAVVILKNGKRYGARFDGKTDPALPSGRFDSIRVSRMEADSIIQLQGLRGGQVVLQERWTLVRPHRIEVVSVERESGAERTETRVYKPS